MGKFFNILLIRIFNMKKHKFRVVLTVLIILLVVGWIAYPKLKPLFKASGADNGAGPGQGPGRGGAGRSLNVIGMVIKPQRLSEVINSSGTLMPDEEVDLSFEASGKIVKINFTEGTRVKKGDLLAKINDNHLQAQLVRLQAQKKLAEEREFRQKSLLSRDAISQESYDQAVTELEILKADIMLLQARIAETEIRAPFDGVIGLRYLSEGSFANPTSKIARLIKLSPLKLEFSIPERYAGEVAAGFPISFTVDGLADTLNAKVYAVDPKVDIVTRTIVVRALYPNTNEGLKPGRFASVQLELSETPQAIAIPTEALIPQMGGDQVYIYKNGQATAVTVSTGLRTSTQIQVLKGLEFGDTLLTTGVLQLRQGLKVTLDKVL